LIAWLPIVHLEGVRRFQAQGEKEIPPPPLRSASE